MSSATPGSDPDHPPDGAPQDQPRWGAPPPLPTQGHGEPAESWPGAPAGQAEQAATGARPPQVLASAFLGFVVAFFALIGAVGLFALSSVFGAFALFGALYLAIAAVNVWGGVLVLRGRGSVVLKIGGAVTAGLAALSLVTTVTQGEFSLWSVLLLLAGGAIVVFLSQPVSQQWFASRGVR